MQKNIIRGIKLHIARQFNLPDEQIEAMMPSFISTLREHMSSLEDALADNDPLLLAKAGHTIKGACLNLGLEDCAQIAFRIEQKGRAGDPSTDFTLLVEELRLKLAPALE